MPLLRGNLVSRSSPGMAKSGSSHILAFSTVGPGERGLRLFALREELPHARFKATGQASMLWYTKVPGSLGSRPAEVPTVWRRLAWPCTDRCDSVG